MSRLTFNALRTANKLRLPQFKNSKGEPAHSRADGADWNPAQWLQAVLGELGEYARVRMNYECGLLSYDEFCVLARKELADVQTYLDLLSMRALDRTWSTPTPNSMDTAQLLQVLVAGLGEYANERKKFERGDIGWPTFDARRVDKLQPVQHLFTTLMVAPNRATAPVAEPHPTGIDLGEAVVDKFNEVSVRVGSTVRLQAASDGEMFAAIETEPARD